MKENVFSQEPWLRTFSTAILMVAVLVSTGFLFAESPGKFSIMAIGAILLVFLTIKNPEIILALFITAGMYKDDPRFHLPVIDTTVLLGIFTAIGLYLQMRKSAKVVTPPLKMSMPFIFICVISAFSLTYTMAPAYGLDKLLKFSTLTGLAYFGAFYLLRGKNRIRNFMAAYIMVSMVIAFDVIQKSPKPGGDISAFNSNYLAMGEVMAASFIMIFLYFFLTEKSPVRRAFYLIVPGLASLYVLMITGARGPFLSLITTLGFILIFAGRSSSCRRRMRLWVIGLLAATGIYLSYDYENFTRMSSRLALLDQGAGRSVAIRISMIKTALEAMTTMPYFLIGLGIGGFSWYYGVLTTAGNFYLYPHNILLELGSETGIFGLASIVLLFYWSFRKAYSMVKKTAGDDYYIAVTVLSIFIYMLLNSLKSGDLNDHRLLFAIVGAIYALDRDQAERFEGHGVEVAENRPAARNHRYSIIPK